MPTANVLHNKLDAARVHDFMLLLPVMVIEVIVVLFVLGLCLGSFVNAFIWRFHEQDAPSISKGRSMCVHCRHELAPKDLIPVISYVWLRGRCRYCRKPIQDTPLTELLTPLLFIISYIFWPLSLSPNGPQGGAGLVLFCFWLAFLVGFVALSVYDLRWYELPHDIVFWLICLAIVQVAVVAIISGHGHSVKVLTTAGWGAAVMVGIFGLLYRISPQKKSDVTEPDEVDAGRPSIGTRVIGLLFGWLLGDRPSKWIGGGDITLGLLLGLIVGGPGNALLLIFIASLLGTLVALPLLLTGRATRTSHLPFGPFLMAAAVIVMLWGPKLIAWYTGQFVA